MADSNRLIPLQTTAFECFFETDTGFVRRIQVGNIEVIRALYGAVRDHNWATILPVITVTALEHERDGFLLRFSARCKRGGISFWWEGCLSATGGELSCEFHGEAKSDFLRNRIGFCLLHPIRECAGKPARFTTPDGREYEGCFPDDIAPHQPFLELKTFTWNPGQGITATLAFEGDVFEMEDQRNWTDASFKTYCTPLSQPLPVPVHAGDRVDQRIKLAIRCDGSPREPLRKTEPILDFSEASASGKPLPSLGFQFVGSSPHPEEVLELLAPLCPNHLRVDLDLAAKDWRKEWRRASNVADRLNAKLHAALFLSEDSERELTEFRGAAQPTRVNACLVFDKASESTSLGSYTLARRMLDGLPVVVGTNGNFTELNRLRPPREAAMVYSFNPQVHAFDDLSVMETLEAQAATVKTARGFCDGPIHVSPITLRPRLLPSPAEPEDDAGAENALPAAVDARQRELITAAWTVGTLANLLGCEQVASLTFFETVGCKGVLAGPELPPAGFGAQPSEIYPIYHVFRALADATKLLGAGRNAQLAWLCFYAKGRKSGALVANLRPEISQLQFRAPLGATSVQVRLLDRNACGQADSLQTSQQVVSEASTHRLGLPPYAVAFARFA
jgi:hypothetical protein